VLHITEAMQDKYGSNKGCNEATDDAVPAANGPGDLEDGMTADHEAHLPQENNSATEMHQVRSITRASRLRFQWGLVLITPA
jgi:hypothetical protein